MKLTKADRLRIAVGRDRGEYGRSILYYAPRKGIPGEDNNTQQQIARRVRRANQLYDVFFKGDSFQELAGHFRELVKQAADADNLETLEKILREYQGYEKINHNGTSKLQSQRTMRYALREKDIRKSLEQYVREQLTDTWQRKEYTQAAVAILQCICDGRNWDANIQSLKNREMDMLSYFLQACKECHRVDRGFPCIVGGTQELEKQFTLLMKGLVGVSQPERESEIVNAYYSEDPARVEACLDEQIRWLTSDVIVQTRNKDRQMIEVNLSEYTYAYATEERMRAILVRMRKALKRGANGETAILLLQALAQHEGMTLQKVATVSKNSAEYQALREFVDAVNRDYYKIHIFKSVRNTDVKVQIHRQDAEPESTEILALSGIGKEKQQGLHGTLARYAMSAVNSDQVLLNLKTLVFEYFIPKQKKKESYLRIDKLWRLPIEQGECFDVAFEAVRTMHDQSQKVSISLKQLWEQPMIDQKQVKDRIRYVNYGKYLHLVRASETLDKEEQDFCLYWSAYIKAFVEKNYVKTQKTLSEAECTSIRMMTACWKEILRFLCGKYMDIGKAVYHFAMPEDLSPMKPVVYGQVRKGYRQGISSFDYETIKAGDTLKRSIAVVTVSAVHNFSGSVIDEQRRVQYQEKMIHTGADANLEDIFFIKEEVLEAIRKDNVVKQILRYFGGRSCVQESVRTQLEKAPMALVWEILDHLKRIRNRNFHYAAGADNKIDYRYAQLLWNNEITVYGQRICERYYKKMVSLFYREDHIRNLVTALYSHTMAVEAQVPNFSAIWNESDTTLLARSLCNHWNQNVQKQQRFEEALQFLLKEIYVRDFSVNEEAGRYFLNAVSRHVEQAGVQLEEQWSREAKQHLNAAEDFKRYVDQTVKILRETEGDGLPQGEIRFSKLCQFVVTEYCQQNQGKKEDEIYKHFKLLLNHCTKQAFLTFIEKEYAFIMTPEDRNIEKGINYLKNIEIQVPIREMENSDHRDLLYDWFVYAHFVHPAQLEALIRQFKGYIQYRESILRRMEYAGQLTQGDIEQYRKELESGQIRSAKEIVQVLGFVQQLAGRLTSTFDDYYDDKEAYARYMAQYIDLSQEKGETAYDKLRSFCREALGTGFAVDIYAEGEKPRLLRHVEWSRMYAGGDEALHQYRKITREEIQDYYRDKEEVRRIVSNGHCETLDQQKMVLEHRKLASRIKLEDVTSIYHAIYELLGQLVSMSYLRERDEMYLLLGFYYMALQAERCSTSQDNGWGEIMDSLEFRNYHVEQGLVLYQVLGVFDFGTKLLCYDEEKGKWNRENGSTSLKIMKFNKMHRKSLACALRLFEDDKYSTEIAALRNYVDHFKYYADHKKSIVDLYAQFFAKFFGYSTKLRKNLLFLFSNVLEEYAVESKLTLNEDEKQNTSISVVAKSQKHNYKLRQGGFVRLDARSTVFVETLKKELEYSR